MAAPFQPTSGPLSATDRRRQLFRYGRQPMEGVLWYLKRCDLFEHLTDEQAERLNRNARVRTFQRRDIVYAPGQPGEVVLVLAAGRIKIKDLTPDGKETILAFIEEGELFGELALIEDDQPRQEYAEAVADSRVLVLPREDVLWLMETRPDVALSVTKLIGLRRRRIENRLRNVLFLSSRQRMIRLLIELVETHGTRRGTRIGMVGEIGPPLSHQDLASLIGMTRETVTVILGQLQSEGLIKVQRRRLTVLNCKRLYQEGNAILAPEADGAPRPLRNRPGV